MAHELPASLQYGFRYGSIRNLFDVRFIQSAVTTEYSPECEQTKCSSNFIFLYINKATSLEYCLSPKLSPECSRLVAGPGSGPGSSILELWWTAWLFEWFFSEYCRFHLLLWLQQCSVLIFRSCTSDAVPAGRRSCVCSLAWSERRKKY